jgi:mono/diheme cytochrome c family protein
MARYVVALVLILGALGLVGVGCGGDDDSSGTPATTAETATAGSETTTGSGETGDAVNGKAVFASAGCGSCHTYSKAGSSGSIGPNLDDLAPSSDTVVRQVTNGGGAMPSFKDQLSEQEIRDVAAFVSGSSS